MTTFMAPIEKGKVRLTGSATGLLVAMWFLLCVPVPVARAYYDVPEPPQAIFRQGERQTSPSAAVDAFVFYEHIDPALSGTVKMPPLKHYSNRFVPADRISANQPIHMALRRPIDPANEVANSLYANLKLKRLLEEYADLQRRARELLTGLGNPATASENRSGAAGQPASLHQLQEDLRQKQLAVSRTLPVIATGATPPGDAKTDGAGAPLPTMMDNYRITDTAAAPGGADGSSSVSLSVSAAERGDRSQNTAASLPWIIEVVFNIISYLIANKVEAIIYGVVLMTILMGASALLRR